MQYKKKLIWLLVIMALVTVARVVVPYKPAWTIVYADYIFVPYQSLRNVLFGWLPLSFGDILYFILGLALVLLPLRWIYFLITIRKNQSRLIHSFFNTAIMLASVFLLFLLGWGGNYYKPSLTTYWGMDKEKWVDDSTEIVYERFLLARLNEQAVNYQPLSFKEVRKKGMLFYKEHTDCKARMHGLNIKPSLYGFFMQYFGIQGYYNPLTGEAQVNRFLPSFMLPFVVVHEMAHQAGIAAEDDANLLAYTISVQSGDPTFQYSAYLNMWLYNHYRLRRKDSVLANEIKAQLNDLTLHHIDTLRQIRERYKNEFNTYTTSMYDVYLKLLEQEEGIGSYNEAVATAWAWESTDSLRRRKKLDIP
jgi:hypothetical protein